MEARMRKFGVQSSPERSRPAPKMKAHTKVPVVYYLCRNRHLEHPHFIEVPISSHDGFHLRDFIKRLVELRGKGMPCMYSWSCKRSYKNGFVWHDLCEDDLILPVHGNEYVLKGSELLDQSPPADRSHSANATQKSHNPKPRQLETPTSSKTLEASSSSSSSSSHVTVIKDPKAPPLPSTNEEDEQSEFIRVCKPNVNADASTQTDGAQKKKTRENAHIICTRGVSTDDCALDVELDVISPPPTSSCSSSSGEKIETLENLILEDTKNVNSFRAVDGDGEVFVPVGPKLRATTVLMQLITCGSLSVKDNHSFGLVQNYKPAISQMKFPTPMLAGSMMLGELDCLSENPRLMGLRVEEKEYFSGSLIETKKHKEEVGNGVAALKRSSSYDADRCKSPDSKHDKDEVLDSSGSKCLPRSIKIPTPNKQYKNGMMRSPISECPRISSGSAQSSLGGSKRITNYSSVSSMRLDSFKEEKEKVIKIEERLTSGALVIIQSRAPCGESEGSSSS